MRRLAVGTLVALCVSLLGSIGSAPAPVAAAALSGTSKFVALPPTRVVDSRFGVGISGEVPPGGTVTLSMARGGVPSSGVVAVLLNVTLAEARSPGFVQVFPTGLAAVGASSNLNIERANQTIPNLVIAPLGVGGMVSIYTQGGGQLIADVFGYFVDSGSTRGGRYVPVFPNRLLDTRSQPSKLGAGGSVPVQVTGRFGVPPAGVAAVVMNVTATEATAAGYVQVLPSDTGVFGGYSNLNVVAGQTIANTVVVPVGADGSVTVFSERGTHVIVDVFGYFTNEAAAESTDGLFVPTAPMRLFDSRDSAVPVGGSVSTIAPRGRGGIPTSGVAAVFGNVTATQSVGAGYVQVAPGPASVASVASVGLWSNLNVERLGETIPNAVIANLGTDGSIVLFTSNATHLIFDASGYFTGNGVASPPPTGTPCVVHLHGKGAGAMPEWTGVDGIRHSFPGGNAEGWGGSQWLYFPDANYQSARNIVAQDVAAGGCGRVVIDGFSNGAAFAAKLYCRGETFGGRVVGYVIDDPVVDHAVEGCLRPPMKVVIYWTGDIALPDGWDCVVVDWTCEGDSTIGIERYEAAIGVVRTPSIFTTHQQYVDPPELHTWF